jgi:hypothetical protein
MKKIILFLSFICSTFHLSAQSVLGCAGNNQIVGALQQSYTLGESFIGKGVVNTNVNSQGFQQPEIPQFQLRFFIQGFYLGGGFMNAVADPVNSPLVTDTISFSLMSNQLVPVTIFQKNVLLSTDGYCNLTLPSFAYNRNYYLKINHRNSIETWSKLPVQLKTFNKYNFSTP